jgi:transposase
MRFYTHQHQYYCGIDLHARTMYMCILDQSGEVIVHKNIQTNPDLFLKVIAPYREDVVVAVECIFTWYWIADLCARQNIPFVLGHALYMKAIHGAKTKNDKIDSRKIAVLLRGGMVPMAYVYPSKMRSTRDLLRRRMHLMRKRAELIAHIQNTNTQYNLPPFGKKIAYKSNRIGIEERFCDESVRENIELDLSLLNVYDKLLNEVELYILCHAKVHDMNSLQLLQTIPNVGKILSLVMLYEIYDINRFPRVQDFSSYARLIKPVKESAGKKYGSSNKKIGNQHLKWAFSEAACLFLRANEKAQKYLQRLERKHGKPKAMAILSHKLGRCVFYMLKRKQAFDINKFLNG